MITFFNRSWYRTELYVRQTPDEFLELIQELHNQVVSLYQNNDFKNLSDPEKTKVLDQFKTAMDVCWGRAKTRISKDFLSCEDDEKAFYAKKNNKPKIEKRKVRVFYNKEEFESILASVNEKGKYLDLIRDQLGKLEEVIQESDYQNLHVLEQRKVKDMYVSSLVLCWKRYTDTVIKENTLMTDYVKAEKLKEHVKNRRARHAERGIKKAEFKKTRNQLIDEMANLPEEEFNRIQKELEREYRQLRGLPEVPEV